MEKVLEKRITPPLTPSVSLETNSKTSGSRVPPVIIADPGSTHMGKLEYALELIDISADIGVDYLKFQLFPDQARFTAQGNIALPYEWWPQLMERAESKHVMLAASVFDDDGLLMICKHPVNYVKFSYSMRGKYNWVKYVHEKKKKVMVSCDLLEIGNYDKGDIKLLCVPDYPVKYTLDFYGMFNPGRFDGFSDHTLGWHQTINAFYQGAGWIEKHIRLDHGDVKCPDALFALSPDEMYGMIKAVKG